MSTSSFDANKNNTSKLGNNKIPKSSSVSQFDSEKEYWENTVCIEHYEKHGEWVPYSRFSARNKAVDHFRKHLSREYVPNSDGAPSLDQSLEGQNRYEEQYESNELINEIMDKLELDTFTSIFFPTEVAEKLENKGCKVPVMFEYQSPEAQQDQITLMKVLLKSYGLSELYQLGISDDFESKSLQKKQIAAACGFPLNDKALKRFHSALFGLQTLLREKFKIGTTNNNRKYSWTGKGKGTKVNDVDYGDEGLDILEYIKVKSK